MKKILFALILTLMLIPAIASASLVTQLWDVTGGSFWQNATTSAAMTTHGEFEFMGYANGNLSSWAANGVNRWTRTMADNGYPEGRIRKLIVNPSGTRYLLYTTGSPNGSIVLFGDAQTGDALYEFGYADRNVLDVDMPNSGDYFGYVIDTNGTENSKIIVRSGATGNIYAENISPGTKQFNKLITDYNNRYIIASFQSDPSIYMYLYNGSALSIKSIMAAVDNVQYISQGVSGERVSASSNTKYYDVGVTVASGFGTVYSTAPVTADKTPHCEQSSDDNQFAIEGRGSTVFLYQTRASSAGEGATGGTITTCDIGSTTTTWAASGSEDKYLRMYTNVNSSTWSVGDTVFMSAIPTTVKVSSDSSYILVGSEDGEVSLYQTLVSQLITSLTADTFITVHVYKDGKPVSGENITLQGAGTSGIAYTTVGSYFTDDKGNFVFTAASGSYYKVIAYDDNGNEEGQLVILASRTNYEYDLPITAAIEQGNPDYTAVWNNVTQSINVSYNDPFSQTTAVQVAVVQSTNGTPMAGYSFGASQSWTWDYTPPTAVSYIVEITYTRAGHTTTVYVNIIPPEQYKIPIPIPKEIRYFLGGMMLLVCLGLASQQNADLFALMTSGLMVALNVFSIITLPWWIIGLCIIVSIGAILTRRM